MRHFPESICDYEDIKRLWRAASGGPEDRDLSIFKVYPKLMWFERMGRDDEMHPAVSQNDTIRVMNPVWPFMDEPGGIAR